MFVINRAVDGLMWLAGATFMLLHRLLFGLLAGMRALASGLSAATDALWQFALEFGFFLGQIVVTLLRVGLILLPGGALLGAGLLYDNPWLWAPGSAYLLLCLAIGFAYRGAGRTGPLAGNVPSNWLAFFPYSWTQYDHLAPALARLLGAHGEIKDAIRECSGGNAVAEELKRIECGMHRYLRKVRRELAARIKRHKGSDEPSPKRSRMLKSSAREVAAVADRFSEVSTWALRIASHPTFSVAEAGSGLRLAEDVAQHIENLRCFAEALDSLERDEVFMMPRPELGGPRGEERAVRAASCA